jgi:multidrug efflux pump subunit AcrA (membrane-fusion protein)
MRYILVLLPWFLVVGCRSGEEGNAKPVVAVSVQRVSVEDVSLVVSAPASIFGRFEAHIASRITAPVRQVLVHKGEAVKEGQLLAVLDQSDLKATQAEASSSVAVAEATLQVQGGRIPDQLSQAGADLTAKTAALDLAREVHERRKQLFSQGAISGRELQISEVAEIQARADHDAAKTRLDLLDKQISSADLKIAQNNLVQAKARQELATANLTFTELRSPINGVVTDQAMYAGDMAKPDMPMFTVDDLSSAVARAQVNADQAGTVSIGQACTFDQKQETPAAAARRFGKITVVNQAVDPTKYTVEAWCEIPNPDHTLKAGVFGSVRIVVGQARRVVVVPSSAIEFEEGTSRGKIYTVDVQHVAHLQHVQAVALDDDRVRVFSGLNPGDLVVIKGEYGLPDGTKVSINEVQK